MLMELMLSPSQLFNEEWECGINWIFSCMLNYYKLPLDFMNWKLRLISTRRNLKVNIVFIKMGGCRLLK